MEEQIPKYHKHKHLLFSLILLTLVAVGVTSFVGLHSRSRQESKTPQIITKSMPGDGGGGSIIEGTNTSQKNNHIATNSAVTYESAILESAKPKANAAILHWDQVDNAGETINAFRIYDGKRWTDWVESSPATERKDQTSTPHAALVLATQIHKIQYRFEVIADSAQAISPEINLASAEIELVDTTKGPRPTKRKSAFSRLLNRLNFVNSAVAESDDPRIISRAEWGSPEPNSSERWTPQYRPMERIIVHHTAMAAQGDSAAAVRAVWHYHANSLGWGDIGYNYLVDNSGNIFQGRYYDASHAEKNSVDVVGGHAYEYNYGSTGIAALGDFTNSEPSGDMLNAISNIGAFKIYRYGINPAGWHNGLPVVVGHRDVIQTACPAKLHNHLGTIRTLTANKYHHYQSRPFVISDYEIVKSMTAPQVYLVMGNQLRPIGSGGHRDCFIMAYHGRMRSVTSANISSMATGPPADKCSPPDYTWYHNEGGHQQYLIIFGGMYTVGLGDVQELGGTGKAKPLSDEGIQYLHDNYVNPTIPNNILLKGATQATVYKITSGTFYPIPNPDTRDCLISQLGPVKGVAANLVNTYQGQGKISSTQASCTITTGQIMHPNGYTVAQIVSGNRRHVLNGAIRDCIIGRTATGDPYKVSQSTWDDFLEDTNAFCPYDSSIRFAKEAGSPEVWRVFSEGRKQHADGFCVADPWTTVNPKYRVWTVPNGETAGHLYDGVFSATPQNCQAVM